MKAILVSMLLAGLCLAFGACETDLPPATTVGNRLERGVLGEGQIVQPDRSEDPLINESTRVGY